NSYRDKLDENAINLLEIIKNGGEKSLNLVGKIVDISKIESDNYILNKQTYSLTKIIKESVNSITDDLMNCNINFKYKLSEDIYSDVDKLRIKHAIKEILTYLIQITKRKSISIYLKKVENIGELLIKSEFDQQIVPNILLELPYSKEIIKLHNGQIFTELGKHKTDLTIKIHLPIKKWKEALIQLYIICKSGIPLYHHDFSKFGRNHDSSLISGGIIGLMTILKAILQGETQIKSIDHGDRTIIFDSNRTKDIVFVLIVKENIIVFERKLASLIEEFDKNYKRLIEDIEENCVDQDNWRSLKYLVQKYFEMSE
ncbi:MAG: sensor histidine kinase, partial [Candidatus Heimdallarchaeota archaeon]